MRDISIAGVDVELDLELSRIGMVGTLAYEIRGPLEAGPAVYDAVYRAGQDFGIKRLGWRTYAVNHTEGGFPQVNCTFLPAAFADAGFAQQFAGMLNTNHRGSIRQRRPAGAVAHAVRGQLGLDGEVRPRLPRA